MRSEYSRLIKPGNNTLQTAMARPRTAVPMYKLAMPEKDRKIIPRVKKMIEMKRIRSTPNLFPSFGTKGEKNAKASKGSVVVIPANVFEICRSFRMSSTKGPTEVKGARKLTVIKIIPNRITQGAAC